MNAHISCPAASHAAKGKGLPFACWTLPHLLRVQQNGSRGFPVYAGIKCEFNRALGWAQAEGGPRACSMQEGPGPCGLTEYYKLGES